MTNSFEIAGPLAALYILRQSPAYSSHKFSLIPLYSILRWLFPDNLAENQDKKEESVDLIKSFSFQNKNKNNNNNENEESDSDDDTITSNESDDFLNKNMTRHALYGMFAPQRIINIDLRSLKNCHYMNFIVKFIEIIGKKMKKYPTKDL